MPLDAKSKELRRTIIRILECSRRGHLGSAFSLVEIIRVLYDDVLRYKAENPGWEGRDRFILSKGHGCLALYAVLAEKGFFPESELWKFCKIDGILGGHPEPKIPGVEFSTGSLGHGFPVGIGMALNARYEKAGYRTFVVIGDGEADEGSVWEAALSAGKHKLDNLVVVMDYNKYQSYGPTVGIQDLEPLADKWRSFGFGVREVDGHDLDELKSAFSNLPVDAGKPSVVICHTMKGKGIKFAEGNMEWHHKSGLNDGEIKELYRGLEEY
ncbi:transketolase [Candidatus Woesearchaeota archaeon]|nr:transketolase [Candidatus Woesearchaeota archaeon]